MIVHLCKHTLGKRVLCSLCTGQVIIILVEIREIGRFFCNKYFPCIYNFAEHRTLLALSCSKYQVLNMAQIPGGHLRGRKVVRREGKAAKVPCDDGDGGNASELVEFSRGITRGSCQEGRKGRLDSPPD